MHLWQSRGLRFRGPRSAGYRPRAAEPSFSEPRASVVRASGRPAQSGSSRRSSVTPRGTRALRGLACALIFVTALAGPVMGSAPSSPDPTQAARVKLGLGCWESGGAYDILNAVSGAYGKYQIMPSNWPEWARLYLGSARAKQTPLNQERVASGKLKGLYHWLQGWDRVVYWWLTGSTNARRTTWSPTAVRYVNGILSLAARSATRAGRRTIPASCFSSPTSATPDPKLTSTPEPAGNGSRHRVVTATAVFVRGGPGASYGAVGYLGHGDVVKVLNQKRDTAGRWWIQVAIAHGPSGWVARWYTRAVSS